ncbi:DMT family transporter [Thalassococcus profundi]|uniref:DMT family transporter n=1 Tax=Thalassococcus profundi TaxID=2282382 RepID=A0A369TN00_9RHOB|nr:DMT family transporter [Thalassococcus profundi]RDD66638.1 DMT family transporter [Thalassococcus profundi]
MARTSLYGVLLATFAALLLSPDALFLRLSDMDGMQMLGWRGLCMGTLFLSAWALTSRTRRADMATLAAPAGITVILAQFCNASLFPNAIALAPVAVVLIAIATVPVIAALLSLVIYGERTPRATWITTLLVLAGIALAVSGEGAAPLAPRAALGALFGLGVAFTLALNFVTLRHAPQVPILLAVGLGGLMAGTLGLSLTGVDRMTDGSVPAILVTALLIIPVSFFLLSVASRHTTAANVSLLMLLETVLGPIWVWLGTGEAPTPRMLLGGAIVVTTLTVYLIVSDRQARRRRRAALA